MSLMRKIGTVVTVASALSLGLAGCASDSKKDGTAKKQATVDTWITDTNMDGGQATIRYKANVADAQFKCQTEVNGQSEGWQDCPESGLSFAMVPGARYTVKVKAVAGGVEDTEPYTYSFTAPGAQEPQQPESPFNGPLSTVIVNRAEVGQVHAANNLTLEFAIAGAENVNMSEFRFECLPSTEQNYRLCSRDGQPNKFEFRDLLDGSTYSLKVRAIHEQSGTEAAEAEVSFTVKLAKLQVVGAESLEQQKTGQVNLTFDLAGTQAARVECRINQNNPVECTQGYELDLDGLNRGSHTLVVEAKGQYNDTLSSSVINFCAVACGDAGQPAQPIIQDFLVGNFYRFQVPEGMHVTEYATTKTYNRQLSFYRVMADSDPYYIGNYACDRLFDRRITAATPRGTELDYCHSTPTDGIYKWLTDFRLANNHIEVATDADIVQQAPHAHERIMINVFDADYEFMQSRSRFEMLCLNRRGSIKVSPPIRFLRDFYSEPVHANFFMCDIDLAGGGPGLPGSEGWRVGAFFISKESLPLPELDCFKGIHADPGHCAGYSNPSLLEVVYMARPNDSNWRPENFAQTAQQVFLRHLTESMP